MTIEQRIINVAEKQNYYDSRELRAIALEVRKREDRIKQLEEMYEGVIGEKPELLGSNVMGLLKRELNFAQNRIKQLEEAGDGLMKSINCGCPYGPSVFNCQTCTNSWDAWRKAKEAKP